MNATVMRLTARTLLGRKRSWLLCALPLVLRRRSASWSGCSPARATGRVGGSVAGLLGARHAWCR